MYQDTSTTGLKILYYSALYEAGYVNTSFSLLSDWHDIQRRKNFIVNKMKQLPFKKTVNKLWLFSFPGLERGTTRVYWLLQWKVKHTAFIYPILTKPKYVVLDKLVKGCLKKGKNVPLYTADTEWLKGGAAEGPDRKLYFHAQKRICPTELAGVINKC